MVSASHSDGRGLTPGAGQISPHFSPILLMFWILEFRIVKNDGVTAPMASGSGAI
jgi:hypothetical protein